MKWGLDKVGLHHINTHTEMMHNPNLCEKYSSKLKQQYSSSGSLLITLHELLALRWPPKFFNHCCNNQHHGLQWKREGFYTKDSINGIRLSL